jgi:uncharacterized damage-inducible protein DinB
MSSIQSYVAGWLSHRNALIALLDKVQDKDLHYKPWDGAMSLAELAVHITDSTAMFANIVAGKEKPASQGQAFSSADALRNYVQEKTKETQAALESITGEQLHAEVEFANMKMTGQAMLDMAKEHEIHHKGQLFTYVRMTGAQDLPFFISR